MISSKTAQITIVGATVAPLLFAALMFAFRASPIGTAYAVDIQSGGVHVDTAGSVGDAIAVAEAAVGFQIFHPKEGLPSSVRLRYVDYDLGPPDHPNPNRQRNVVLTYRPSQGTPGILQESVLVQQFSDQRVEVRGEVMDLDVAGVTVWRRDIRASNAAGEEPGAPDHTYVGYFVMWPEQDTMFYIVVVSLHGETTEKDLARMIESMLDR